MSKKPVPIQSQLSDYVRENHKEQLELAIVQMKGEGLRISSDRLSPEGARFSCSKKFPNGGGWLDFSRKCRSEDEAWALAAVTRGLISPGVLRLTSPNFEFGPSGKTDVLEIRQVENRYHVFHVTKRSGVESCLSVYQIHQDKVFPSIGSAAEFVEQFQDDWVFDPESYPDAASFEMPSNRRG